MRDEARADIEEITERMYFQRRFSDAIRDYKRNKEVYEDDIIDVDTLQKPEPTYLSHKKITSLEAKSPVAIGLQQRLRLLPQKAKYQKIKARAIKLMIE